MVRRWRRGANGGGGHRRLADGGLLTAGDTNAADTFSFLPPGLPSGAEGVYECVCESHGSDLIAVVVLPMLHVAERAAVPGTADAAVRTIDTETGVVV